MPPVPEVLRPPGAAQTACLIPLWRLEAEGGGAQRGRARVVGNAWATYFPNEGEKSAQSTPTSLNQFIALIHLMIAGTMAIRMRLVDLQG